MRDVDCLLYSGARCIPRAYEVMVTGAVDGFAAVRGRPLYDVSNEAMEAYLVGLKLPRPSASLHRARTRKGS